MPPVSPSRIAGTFMKVLLGLTAAVPAFAASQPIQIDGSYADWLPAPFMITDPAGDGGGSGIDFTNLYLAHDADWLYVRFNTGVEVQPDEGQSIVFAFDTDMNVATGQSIAGIGADLVWNLGSRSGTFYQGGGFSIGHADIGLVIGSTVSDTQFEFALDRGAVPAGAGPLFPNNDFHMVIVDAAGGDVISLTGAGYTFDSTPQPVPSLPLGRDSAGHVRISCWNVQNDGLFDGGSREAAQNRMADAIDPDIWIISEVWGHGATDVAVQMEQLLPSGAGESWSAVKLDGGNVVVSRFPILGSWEPLPGRRLTAVLVDVRPAYDTDLLVVANHWSCCTADAERQEQADALIAFLRDARTPGGVLDLDANTPIIAGGDFNLVGLRAQLTTLLTGDISDNGTWGPDSPPDWDGSDFEATMARHPDARFTYTWRNDFSSFYPGKLDWIVYTGSVATLHNHFVLDTRTMTPASLTAGGLQAADTEVASDHSPLVGDFAFNSGVAGIAPGEFTGTIALAQPSPNPFSGSTTIRFGLSRTARVELAVYDAGGRLVRVLERGARSPGTHLVRWDGVDEGGHRVPAGLYFIHLESSGQSKTVRSVLLN